MREAKTVSESLSIENALHMIEKDGTEILSVVDEAGLLIGAVSRSSFIKLLRKEVSSLSEPVWYTDIEKGQKGEMINKIMTTNITTVKPDENLDSAIKIMSANGYVLLHVVDDQGKLLGVVKLTDIFEKILE